MAPVYAFSVHKFVNSVGADAGFASIVGLAILVLLYFAHARETASLRDQLADSNARVQDLEAEVAELAHLARSVPAPQPVPTPAPRPVNPLAGAAAGTGPAPTFRRTAPAPVPSSVTGATATQAAAEPNPGGGVAVAGRPGTSGGEAPVAPAGVGAPALTAATKLIPTSVPVAAASAPTGAPAPAPVPAPAPATVAAGAVRPPLPASGPPASNGTAESRAVSRAQPAAAAPRPAAAAPQPATPAPAPAPQAVAQPARASFANPPRQIRPGMTAARQSITPGRSAAPGQRSRAVFVAVLALIAALVVAVIVVLIAITAGGGSATHSTPATAAAPATSVLAPHRVAHARPVDRGSVVVTVLNGTPQAGLARRISSQLTAAGFKQGTVATAGASTHTATVVAYMPGDRAQALAVAGALKLGSASVQPVDQPTQAVACQPSAPCRATVIVTVGADLKTQ